MNHLVKIFLKIGPHLPKLLSNIKWLTFLWDTVYIMACATSIRADMTAKVTKNPTTTLGFC